MNNADIAIQSKQYLAEAYERIGELYKKVSYFGFEEIRRCYPIYFKKFVDLEDEIDKNSHNYQLPFMRHMCENMVAVWQNLVMQIEKDIENKIKKGMPRPISNARYSGLAIYREDCYMKPMLEVGHCTPQEIRDWLDFKITIADLIRRNKEQYDQALNRRFNNSFMIYCEMSDDGSTAVQINLPLIEEKKPEVQPEPQKPVEPKPEPPKKAIAFEELEVIEEVLDLQVTEGWL